MTRPITGGLERRRFWSLEKGLCLCGFILMAALVCPARSADWPTYRGDIARSGVTADRLGRDLSLHWTYRSLQLPRPAWPMPSEELPRMHVDNALHVAIAQGVVYFGCPVTDKVLAIDAASGDLRWAAFVDGPVRFAPTVCEGRIFFGSDDGHVYCLDAASGSLIWKYRAGPSDEKVIGNGRMISLWPVRTSVLVDGGLVHFAAGVFPYEGLYVGALKADGGSLAWINDTIGDRPHELEYGGISPHGYLVASPRVLYVPSGRAMPAAFDRANGKFLFSAAAGGKRGGVWALLDHNRLIAGIDNSGVPVKAAYDAQTGERQEDAFAWFQGLDMAVSPDSVYLVTEDGVSAVDRAAYARAAKLARKLAAERQALTTQLAKLREKGRGAGRTGTGGTAEQTKEVTRKLAQITAQQGQLKGSVQQWHYAGKSFTSVIRAGDRVVAGGQGIVVALDVASGKQVWRHSVEGRAVGLAAAGGRLVVSTDAGHVYCFSEGPPAAVTTIGGQRAANPYGEDPLAESYRAAARKIVAESGVTKGYCLVLDCGEGRLAYELARQTDLQIVGLEADPAQRATARSRLDAAGLLGSRVAVEPWDLRSLPDGFANLIVSDRMVVRGEAGAAGEEVPRVLRPWGGVAYLSLREGEGTGKRFVRGPLEGAGSWTQQYADPQNTACSNDKLVNGPLGILWFGEPGPQGMVERHAAAQAPVAMDGRLFVEGEHHITAWDAFNGTLLWRREIPGAVRVNVKADSGNLALRPDGLYVAAGNQCYRLSPQTGETIRVYQMPESGPGEPRRWGYLSVAGKVLCGSAATAMDQDYGAILEKYLKDGQWKAPHEIPPESLAEYERLKALHPEPADLRMAAQRLGYQYRWMTSFARGGEFTQKNAVTPDLMTSDQVFALDTETGKVLWSHRGKRIANVTLTLGDGQVFFADSAVTPEQRREALARRRQLMQSGIYRARPGILQELEERTQLLAGCLAERKRLAAAGKDHAQLDTRITQVEYFISSLKAELFQQEAEAGTLTEEDADVRLAVAVDIRSGKKLWERPVDLTGCGGDKMGAAYRDGLLFFFGNHGNHDAWRFREGGMKWRRITALAAATGEMVWSRPLNYRTRPVIVGDRIILEPQACNLRTGETVMREHPVTGQPVPWEFLRPGHTCGLTAASAEGLFYRSACTAFYDMAADRGVTIFGGYRPGCAISVIPACGVLLSPEAAAGCTCSYPIRCTVALKRKPARQQPWTVYVTPGELRPVKHLAVNFGAPSDMKDDEGTVWFAYPNPNTSKYTHFPNYGVKFDLQEEVLPGMGYFCSDFKRQPMPGTDKPWLFISGCRGLLRCEVPLLDGHAGQKGATYHVRLGFAAPGEDIPGQRVFDIKLQGKVVQAACDIARLAGEAARPVVLDYRGVPVTTALVLELVPKAAQPTERTAPIINFLEVRRQE